MPLFKEPPSIPRRPAHFVLFLLSAALLAACGGGGSGGSTTTPVVTDGVPMAANTLRIEPVERIGATALVKAAAVAAVSNPVAVALGALPAGAVEAAASGSSAPPGAPAPRPIGLPRASAATATVAATTRLLAWQPVAGGAQAAALRFTSDGAAALRIGVLVQQLPPQATLRVWGTGGSYAEVGGGDITAALARNAQAGERGAAASTYWLPAVGGGTATLEITLPAGVPTQSVQLSVPLLSHLWVDLASPQADLQLKIGEAGSCNVDAMCTDVGPAEGRAVARMEFVSGGVAFLCSGAMLADTAASGIPWFLSANHCVSSQAAASSLSTYWFYRSSSCSSGALYSGAIRQNGGATLLYASAQTDTSFMRLLTAPPAGTLQAGVVVVAPTPGVTAYSAHHPQGDLLKVSGGLISAYATCVGSPDTASCTQQASPDGNDFFAIRWSSGTTQAGSSGAPLLAPVANTGRRYVVGQLYAGLASCSTPTQPDYFGRLDVAYRAELWKYLGDVPGAR